MLHIGIRAHDFGVLSPGDSAAQVADSGACCIQLALSKAHPSGALYPSELGPAELEVIRSAYNAKNIGIAILGSYINPVHPDAAIREKELARFEDHLAAAAALDCSIVGTETGSRSLDASISSETASEACFQDLVHAVRRLTAFAEKTGKVRVGIEAVAERHTISSAALMARLIKEAGSPALGVIFDPCNLVPSTGIRSQQAFIDDCFDAFGEHIIAVHAKDYVLEDSPDGPKKSSTLPAGSGDLDWKAIFRKLEDYGKADVPILLEEIKPESIPSTIQRLQALWDSRKS